MQHRGTTPPQRKKKGCKNGALRENGRRGKIFHGGSVPPPLWINIPGDDQEDEQGSDEEGVSLPPMVKWPEEGRTGGNSGGSGYTPK